MNATSPTTGFSSWMRLAGDALTLKPEPYERLAAKPTLRYALLIVLVVGLIVGAVNALIGIPSLFRSPAAEVENAFTEMQQGIDQVLGMMGQVPDNTKQILDAIQQSIEAYKPTIEKIVAIPAPLPGFFGRFFTWLGRWLSTPFGLLAKWLGISIWIMLFARLLGGRGGLIPYLSASSLSVIPHLLGALSFIPCVGGLLGLAASIWGLFIQYKAVQTTQGLSQGRSIVAVLLPYLLLALLISLVAIFVGVSISSAINAAAGGGQ